MTVYVDEFRRWGAGPSVPRCFREGSSHMTADTIAELHAMADRIGLRRAWFQGHGVPHYDLTRSKRDRALRAGAVFERVLLAELARAGLVVLKECSIPRGPAWSATGRPRRPEVRVTDAGRATIAT